jgi:hypothetical protein
MMFGVGIIFDPYGVAFLISFVEHAVLFMFCGAMHLVLAGFTLFRIVQQRPMPAAVKKAFVVMLGSTQAILPLDPQSGGESGRKPAAEPRTVG